MARLRRPFLVLLALVLTALNGCHFAPRRSGCDAPPCLHGIIPTVLTPYTCDGIDLRSLEQQMRRELAGGCHGLFVLGTLGEGEYMPFAERAAVIATAVRVAAGCVPVIVGIHTCDVNKARAQMRQAKELGATAVIVKYVGNPRVTSADVLSFFTALSDSQILPILYYHFPEATGLHLSPEEIAAILRLPMVIGIKESTLALREVAAHIRLTHGEGKAFFTGTMLDFTQFMDLGGHGAMSPEAVLVPQAAVHAYQLYQAGRHREARVIQEDLYELLPLVSTRSTPPALVRPGLMTALDLKLPVPLDSDHPQARLKLALNHFGVRTPTDVRPPLPPLTPCDERRVETAIGRIHAIDWCHPGSKFAEPPEARLEPGGLLLNTGAIQLGPGLWRNAYSWMGDGQGKLD